MLYLKNNKTINYGNRGMVLEEDINQTNTYYYENKIALINKKPTPIKVLKVSIDKKRIIDGFYEKKSTLDYSGIYKGKYIEFDAKETNNKTSFPIANIHTHQIKHIENVINYGGIAFLIIRFNYTNETFILMGEDLINYLNNNEKKSIPLSYFQKYCHKILLKYRPRIDYLKVLDKIERSKGERKK